MGKAATQKDHATENFRESTLPDFQTSSKATNGNPFHGSTGALSPFQDKDTLINLQLVSNLLSHTPHPIIVSGVTGSGKSTFLRLFIHHCQSSTQELNEGISVDWQIIKFKAASRSKPNRLIKQICSSLDLTRVPSAQELYQAINQQRLNDQQRPIPLLIIDNAHLLSQASLELIAGLTEYCSSKIHIIMGSLPELQTQFNHEDSKIRIGVNAHVLNIRPLTLEQTNEYLNRQIQNAGMSIPFTLTDVQVARIHKQSRGIPGEINQVAQLLCKSSKTSAQIAHFATHSSHHPSLWQRIKILSNSISFSRAAVLPILAVFITGIAIGLFVQRDSLMQLWRSDTATARLPIKVEPTSSGVPTITSIESHPNKTLTKIGPTKSDKTQIAVITIKPIAEKIKTSEIKKVNVEAPQIKSDIIKTIIVKSTHTVKATRVKSHPTQIATIPSANSTTLAEKTIDFKISKIVAHKIKRRIVAKSNKSLPQASQNTQADNHSWNLPFSKYLTAKTFQDKAWLLKQNPRNYTIQLLSAKRWKTVKQYQETYKFGLGLASYQIRFKGSDWHVLVYGEFTSRKKAIERIKTFPEALRGNKFRIRKLRYVQREVKRGVILPRKKLVPANKPAPYVEPPSVTYPNPSLLP